MKTPLICVVGAGVAGISCSRYLSKLGFGVRIFEKYPIIGGRIPSLPFSANFQNISEAVENNSKSQIIDHGAQYFTAKDESKILQNFVKDNLDIVEWEGNIKSLVWENDIKTTYKVEDLNSKTVRYIGKDSIGSIWENCVEEMKNEGNFEIKLNEKVENIKKDKNNDKWIVNNEYTSDWIVLTGTPNEIKNVLGDSIGYYFPENENIIRNSKMNPVYALMMKFEENYSAFPDNSFDAAFVNHSDSITWICKENSKINKNDKNEYWIVHFDPFFCAENINMSVEEAFEIAQDVFVGKYAPDDMKCNWKDICVSKKFYLWEESDIQDPLKEVMFINKKEKIAIAADWINNERVEGAFLSGYYTGEQIKIEMQKINET